MRPYRNKTTPCTGFFFCTPLDIVRQIDECIALVECRVDVAAAKMGRDNLSTKSHDTKNPRKLGLYRFLSRGSGQSGGL